MTREAHALAVVEAVAGIPTAPFHEEAVARYLAAALQACGFVVQQDRFGNLLARLRRGGAARPLALVAHMDHPGLVVTSIGAGIVTADVLGGIKPGVLAPGTAVRFYDRQSSYVGEVQDYIEDGRGAGHARPFVRATVAGPLAGSAFGTLDLPACHAADGVLALRAADDLAQCACLLLVAERLSTLGEALDLTFVLTRAEEIGLIGATLVAQTGILPRDAVVVSLECSKAGPGAEIGNGAVIRVGDAGQSFHPQGEALLLAARDRLLEQWTQRLEAPAITIQRQLMSGGRCEASTFLDHGYIATGVVLPLGNYHNADADGRAAPEYIHIDDLLGAVDLLLAAITVCAGPAALPGGRLAALASLASPQLIASAHDWQLGLPPAAMAVE